MLRNNFVTTKMLINWGGGRRSSSKVNWINFSFGARDKKEGKVGEQGHEKFNHKLNENTNRRPSGGAEQQELRFLFREEIRVICYANWKSEPASSPRKFLERKQDTTNTDNDRYAQFA